MDEAAVAYLLRHGYVPAPLSVYQGIYKLPPAARLAIRPGGQPVGFQPWADAGGVVGPRHYWRLDEVAAAGLADPIRDDAEAVSTLEGLIAQAIRGQVISDRPLGSFLSGGIDSSTTAAMMQAQSDEPVRTFTVGFDAEEFDEAGHARRVAEHLGTRHTEIRVSDRDALDLVPELSGVCDEPFADPSQIPTILVSRKAREYVTVCLSGDAGGELLAGYNRYTLSQRLWRSAGVPLPLRRSLAAGLDCVPVAAWDRIASLGSGRLVARANVHGSIGHRIHKLAGFLAQPSLGAAYEHLTCFHPTPPDLLQPPVDTDGLSRRFRLSVPGADFLAQALYRDLCTYLPDDNLTKVDRASMSVALEMRLPLLDHRIVEFSWRVPERMKIRDGKSKWLLRQVLYRPVPRELVERPKMGFSVPVTAWLRGPLREWAEALLEPAVLESAGLFDAVAVRRLWRDHQRGRRDSGLALWSIPMYLAWQESLRGKGRVARRATSARVVGG